MFISASFISLFSNKSGNLLKTFSRSDWLFSTDCILPTVSLKFFMQSIPSRGVMSVLWVGLSQFPFFVCCFRILGLPEFFLGILVRFYLHLDICLQFSVVRLALESSRLVALLLWVTRYRFWILSLFRFFHYCRVVFLLFFDFLYFFYVVYASVGFAWCLIPVLHFFFGKIFHCSVFGVFLSAHFRVVSFFPHLFQFVSVDGHLCIGVQFCTSQYLHGIFTVVLFFGFVPNLSILFIASSFITRFSFAEISASGTVFFLFFFS